MSGSTGSGGGSVGDGDADDSSPAETGKADKTEDGQLIRAAPKRNASPSPNTVEIGASRSLMLPWVCSLPRQHGGCDLHASRTMFGKVERRWKGDSHQIWRTQRVQVNAASLRLFLRSSTGPNRAFEPLSLESLGRVRDPVRIAEGPTAIDAATQRRHFGFRLRLVDKLQPIGGGSGRGHPLSGTWET